MKTFGMELEEEMRKSGFVLRGHFPILRTSLYALEFDLDLNLVTVWYGPKQDKLGTCVLEPREISEKLKGFHEMITMRPFNDLKFLKQLYEAYVALVERDNRKIGDPLPIISLLREFVSLSKRDISEAGTIIGDHRRILFSYDLFRLKRRKMDNLELDLIIATRMYTRRKKDYLWVPVNENGEGNFISHARFRCLAHE